MLRELTDNGVEELGGGLSVRRRLCTPLRFLRSGCRACVDACPIGMLRRDGSHWRVDASCDRCGACVGACPTGALDLEPGVEALEERIRKRMAESPGGTVRYSCEHRPGAAGRIRVPGFLRLDEGLILLPLALGAAGVRIEAGGCPSCPPGRGFAGGFDWVLRSVRSILQSCGVDWSRVRVVEQGGEEGKPPPTGAVGRSRRRGGRPPKDPASLGRRARLVSAIRTGGWAPRGAAAASLPTGSITISDRCIGCVVCGYVCPESAIRREESEGGRVVLRFDPSACTACEACQDACLPEAIALERTGRLEALAARERTVLLTLEPRTCVSCGERFPCAPSAGRDRCPKCLRRIRSGVAPGRRRPEPARSRLKRGS